MESILENSAYSISSDPHTDFITQVKPDVPKIFSQIEELQVATTRNNLIFYDIPESHTESECDGELFSKVVPLLPSAECSPSPSTPAEWGKK